MAKPDATVENSSEEEESRWGTWEELLLACAVNRYGTKSWDSVAVELQKRSTAPARLLSPHNCRLKYLDLKRRYSNECNGNGNVNDDDEDKEKTVCVPLLEELRKLRVAELRREVERYDLSIVSLQLKKQRLEEERERSMQQTENGDSKSDLAKNERRGANNENFEETEIGIKPEDKSSPELVVTEEVSEEASDKDQQSVSESSSTDLKHSCSLKSSAEENEDKTKPVRTVTVKTEPLQTGSIKEEPDKCAEERPVREDSCNGSSDSVEKPPVGVTMKVEPVSESPELVESMAESKGGEEVTKENSDVQSSVSKSRKKVDDIVVGGCSSGDEREKENRSPAVKEIPVESQPLIAFLEKIRSHKLGSMFERRLESQEAENYSNLVRQHIDLEMVQSWLENGRYLSCKSKFFRDLLLLVSNAIVFFKKNSSEFVAATELRQLILKEISQTKAKSYSLSGKQTSLKSASLSQKEITKPSDSLLLKTNISGSMIVCRKRSSIKAKASASSSGGDKKREQSITRPVEKVVVDTLQQPSQLASNAGENRITKKRTRDRFASGSASLNKNDKGRPNTASIKNLAAVVDKNQGEGESSSQHPQSKSESRNEQSNTDVKKRSVATFLNRMKQSSSSNSGLLLDALKSRPLSSASKGGSEHKKNESGTGGGRKEPASLKTHQKKEPTFSKNPEAKQAKEKGSPMKKNIGRPPKRGADPSPPSSKRSREGAESAAIPTKQPKKRSRR
ncbi:PREDICTED: uncharacterized protein LOC109244091 [Nicotiana attenuata]|uniref:Bromo domain-containing protein n=1 Tax=Nicotiana attenuata TaxID=49451 RepID=A0A314L0B8_NICAT|nr:PREDICTED: uncharacterized protein LOC109244091 [Nicotiana attenuata]OIT34895.1 hypothetical protein A4A49_25398 [Nicotiana attenuata]